MPINFLNAKTKQCPGLASQPYFFATISKVITCISPFSYCANGAKTWDLLSITPTMLLQLSDKGRKGNQCNQMDKLKKSTNYSLVALPIKLGGDEGE